MADFKVRYVRHNQEVECIIRCLCCIQEAHIFAQIGTKGLITLSKSELFICCGHSIVVEFKNGIWEEKKGGL